MENTDDGTADEWYGPTQEFYFIIAGEFTVGYDTDAARLRRKDSPRYVVRAGRVRRAPGGLEVPDPVHQRDAGHLPVVQAHPRGLTIKERLSCRSTARPARCADRARNPARLRSPGVTPRAARRP